MAAILDLWEGMTGTMLPYALSTAPANGGWLLCDGSVLLAASQHSNLRAKLIADGMKWGSDGSGNPKIPDTRGEFLRGVDNGRGIDADRQLGSGQGHATQWHDHFLPTSTSDLETDSYNIPDTVWQKGGINSVPIAGKTVQTLPAGTTGTMAGETRPNNLAANYIIKT